MKRSPGLIGGAVLLAALSACDAPPPLGTVYLGTETRKLDDSLVNIVARVSGAETSEVVDAYAKCAAAGYALIRDHGFARHVRTNLQERGGIWSADAVYTISKTLPDGLATIDAEVVVEDCAAKGIPTI